MAVEQKDGTSRADSPSVPRVAAGELKFGMRDRFQHELRRRVQEYFRTAGRRQRDCPKMYVKTAVIFTWFAASYVLLVFCVSSWWLALPLAISLGLSMAAIGFNIQHDGGHRAYSDYRWVNKVMALTLDLLGASSYVWAKKHNIVHHSYTNIVEHDDDINLSFLGRLAPHQKRRMHHRLQHYYMWGLYGLMPPKWQLFDNFRDIITGRIGQHRFPRPKGWDLVNFIAGKAVFFSLAFVLPMVLHSIWAVLLFYAVASLVEGVVLGVIFQLAHCVEEAAFPLPRDESGCMENAWAVHQVETTVDFARSSRVLSWFVGGLNFQIEHHLFPQICHVHYPALARLVEETCNEFGLRYKAHKSLLAGIVSHFRWLRRMGKPETA